MRTIQVAARVPKEIRDQAVAVTEEYGLGLSEVVRVFVTRIAKEKRIPLDISKPVISIAQFDALYPEYQEFANEVSEEYLHE
jgi:addiction module RelB/DinJ family antitoxin